MLFYGNRCPYIFTIKLNKMKPNSTQSSQPPLQFSSDSLLILTLLHISGPGSEGSFTSSCFQITCLLYSRINSSLFFFHVVYLHFKYNYLHIHLLSWQLPLSLILGNFQDTYEWYIQYHNFTNFWTSPFRSPLFPLFTNCFLTMILFCVAISLN